MRRSPRSSKRGRRPRPSSIARCSESLRKRNARPAASPTILAKAEQRTKLQLLTAPVDGVVQQLSVHTVGGVVTPAQQLAVVVPARCRFSKWRPWSRTGTSASYIQARTPRSRSIRSTLRATACFTVAW